MAIQTPGARPANPRFSSGPCAKPPTFELAKLGAAPLGRSHRAAVGKAKLKAAIENTRDILGIPTDYKIGIVPASDTGAFEMAMWNLLGERPAEMVAWESFGAGWVTDVVKQLKIEATTHTADYGEIVDMAALNYDNDVCFTWNGTTSGVRVANADWIKPNPDRVVICDATSAVFAQDIEWEKLDVVTYSWQKVLGGEAAHGMLILSPNAVRRLETYTPARALPKIFRMTKGGKLNEALFEGATLNTPSLLCTEDYLQTLNWCESLGGWRALKARSDESLAILTEWEAKTDWVRFMCADPDVRSNTGVTFVFADPRVTALDEAGQRGFVKEMMGKLDALGVAFDAAGYNKAPPGLRIWCGGTVEPSDVAKLTPWLDWAFAETIGAL